MKPAVRPLPVPVFLTDGEARRQPLMAVMKRHQFQPAALLEILHAAQQLEGYLSPETLRFIARGLRLPPSKVYGVATFYHLFTLQPRGRHTCTVCLGTACFMKGGAALLETIENHSAPHQELTLQTARCLGVCGIAPVVVYDGQTAGQQTPEALSERLKGWTKE